MRQLLTVSMVLLVSAGFAAASDVEVKGPHICCAQCIRVVEGILEKVEGVANVKGSIKEKKVTFTANNSATAKAGFKALLDGGFFGAATEDGKELKVDIASVKKGDKVDAVTVKDVHVCCGLCQKAINAVFKDSKVSYEGKGAQRTVRIQGAGLEASAVLQALRNAGFNGKIE